MQWNAIQPCAVIDKKPSKKVKQQPRKIKPTAPSEQDFRLRAASIAPIAPMYILTPDSSPDPYTAKCPSEYHGVRFNRHRLYSSCGLNV